MSGQDRSAAHGAVAVVAESDAGGWGRCCYGADAFAGVFDKGALWRRWWWGGGGAGVAGVGVDVGVGAAAGSGGDADVEGGGACGGCAGWERDDSGDWSDY